MTTASAVAMTTASAVAMTSASAVAMTSAVATPSVATQDNKVGDGYYDLVWSLDEVKSFATLILGSTNDAHGGVEDDVGVVALMCRRKYDSRVLSDSCLASLTFDPTNHSSDLLKKLARLQTRHGSFYSTPKDSNSSKEFAVPVSGMAVYVTLHARSMLTAWKAVDREVNDRLIQCARRKTKDPGEHETAWQPRKLVSFLGKAAMSTHPVSLPWLDLDVDTRDPVWLSALGRLLQGSLKGTYPAIEACVETRGGYHVILSRAKLSKTQFNDLHALANKTSFKKANTKGELVTQRLISLQNANCILPLPGTRQGGHLVRLILPQTLFSTN